MRYLQQILLFSIPIVIAFLCLIPYRMKVISAMNLRSPKSREVCLFLFTLLISGIIALKIWPVYYKSPTDGNILLLLDRPNWDTNFHYIPFTMFVDYYKCCFEYGSSDLKDIITNIVGNFVAFIPIGLLVALLFRTPTLKRSAGVGFTLSLITEAMQYFLMRNASVDDLLLNTLGSVCGFILYLMINRLFPNFKDAFQCKPIKNNIK